MNTTRLTTSFHNTFTPVRAVIAACLLGFFTLIDVVERHQVIWSTNLLGVFVYLLVIFVFEWFSSAQPKS